MESEMPSEPWREPTTRLDAPVENMELPPRPGRRWSKRLLVGVGLVAVLVAGSLGLKSFDAQRDPVPVVEAYLDAIARGDATSANRILRPVEDLKGSPLLSDEALGSATERIKVKSFERKEPEVAAEGPVEDAVVLAKFSLAGEEYEQTFELQAEDQGLAGPDEWQLMTPLVGLTGIEVWPLGQNVRPLNAIVDGEVLVGAEETGKDRVAKLAYPAVYKLELEGGQDYEKVSTQLTVTPADWTLARALKEEDFRLVQAFSRAIGDPVRLQFSQKFKTEMIVQGLSLVEACAAAPEALMVEREGSSFRCPGITNVTLFDACAADPAAQTVQVENWSVGCSYFRSTQPFRGKVTVDASDAVVDTLSESGWRLGPYHFTDGDTGRQEEVMIKNFELTWVEGRPVMLVRG